MKKIILLFVCTLSAGLLMAQNNKLNQTVQVVNAYEGKLNDFDRENTPVAVPDSLRRFDLNFDYSGFDTPYKGSEEFNPYHTELELSGRDSDVRKLYFKAGAGYYFAPEMDLAYTFLQSGRFKMGLHGFADGFYGLHNQINNDSGVLRVQKGAYWTGFNGKARAGIDSRVDWSKVSLSMTADYEGAYGIGTPSGVQAVKSYNGVDVNFDFSSVYDPLRGWKYNIDLGYSFGYDKATMPGIGPVINGSIAGRENYYEYNARARFFGLYDFKNGSAIDVEAKVNFTYNMPRLRLADNYGCTVIATPRYFFNNENVYFGLGASLLYDFGKNVKTRGSMGPGAWPVHVWPALTLHWSAIKGKLDLYADSDLNGQMYGQRLQSLENNFYVPVGKMVDGVYKAENEFVNMRIYNASVGLRGCLWDSLDYDLGGGVNIVANDHLFYVRQGIYEPEVFLSVIQQDTKKVYAKLGLHGHFKAFSFDGKLRYDWYLGKAELFSLPSPLTASLDLKYNILNRASASVGADYRSSYTAGEYKTPYLLDLHAVVDWKITNILTVYLQGSNLLNRSQQYIPLYSRKGVCIAAGIVLNL